MKKTYISVSGGAGVVTVEHYVVVALA